MRYHPEDFLRLVEAVEDQGGVHRDEICKGHHFQIQLPNADGEDRWTTKTTCACQQQALFTVPYRKPGPVDPTGQERDRGTLTACAVDDDMGRWPRFAQAIKEDSN